MQQFGQFVELALQPVAARRGVFAEQLVGGAQVTFAQRLPRRAPVAAVGGSVGQRDQRVGDALHRGHDAGLHGLAACAQQAGDMAIARGVGDGRAAELVCDDGQGRRFGRVGGFTILQSESGRTHAASSEAPRSAGFGTRARIL